MLFSTQNAIATEIHLRPQGKSQKPQISMSPVQINFPGSSNRGEKEQWKDTLGVLNVEVMPIQCLGTDPSTQTMDTRDFTREAQFYQLFQLSRDLSLDFCFYQAAQEKNSQGEPILTPSSREQPFLGSTEAGSSSDIFIVDDEAEIYKSNDQDWWFQLFPLQRDHQVKQDLLDGKLGTKSNEALYNKIYFTSQMQLVKFESAISNLRSTLDSREAESNSPFQLL